MKRKAIVLLSSVLAGALLVGGAFAGYAVTDNADPFGINVTPGNLDVDEETDYITLKWGEKTGLNGVGNIEVGQNRKVGVVSLQASESYAGIFTLTATDVTTGPKTGTAKLIDYLKVYVYTNDQELSSEGALPAEPKATIDLASTTKKITFEATGTPSGAEYSIFVSVDNSAGPVFDQMTTDKVFIEVDWSAKTGDEAEGTLVYTSKPDGWDAVKAYAWDGKKTNAPWPGVTMVKNNEYDNVYQILVLDDRQGSIIFTDGTNQTTDISFEGYDATSKPYWNQSSKAWEKLPDKKVVESVKAEVTIGEDTNEASLNDLVGDNDTQNNHIYKINLAAGAKIQFKVNNEVVPFSAGEETAPDYTASIAGVYTFWLSKDGKIYVGVPNRVVVAPQADWEHTYAVALSDNPSNANEQLISGIQLAAGDLFYFALADNVYLHYSEIDEGGACGNFENSEGNFKVMAEKGGTYNITVKHLENSYKVFFAEVTE